MTERRREAELLKDKLVDEEVDLGWIYPVSIFAEGHTGLVGGGWGFICCLLFISNVCRAQKRRDRDL